MILCTSSDRVDLTIDAETKGAVQSGALDLTVGKLKPSPYEIQAVSRLDRQILDYLIEILEPMLCLRRVGVQDQYYNQQDNGFPSNGRLESGSHHHHHHHHLRRF